MPSMFGDNILTPGAAPLPDPVLEANHRIANNLAIIAALIRSELLTLTKYASDPSYTRRLLQQMSLRIDAVARLHRLLMDTSHTAIVELGAYLRQIVDAATCSLTNSAGTRIICKFEGRNTVSAKHAAAMGLFVSEALVNSIKHAHHVDESGTICVSCRRRARQPADRNHGRRRGAALEFSRISEKRDWGGCAPDVRHRQRSRRVSHV